MEMEDRYKKLRDQINEDLKLDKHNLDTEAENQSRLYMKWSERYLIEKTALDDLEGSIYLDIVNNPKEFDIPEKKVTVDATKSAINTNRKVVEQRLLANLLKNAKDSFEQRRSMIKLLGDLWQQQYYGDIQIKEEVKPYKRRKQIKK